MSWDWGGNGLDQGRAFEHPLFGSTYLALDGGAMTAGNQLPLGVDISWI